VVLLMIKKLLVLLVLLIPALAHSAISVIQATAFGTNVTSPTVATQSFSSAPTTGNAVIVAAPQSNNFTPGNVIAVWDNQGSTSLSSVAITGTAGQFSTSSTAPAVGAVVKISGTEGGTGSITGYTNPTNYVVIASGSGTFTLGVITTGVAVVTTAGTPTGLTYAAGNDVYTKIISQIDGEGGDNCSVEFWWDSSITYVSGTFTIDVTITGSNNTTQIALMEANGIGSVDQTGGAGTTANPLTATATSVNTNANDLEISVVAIAFGASAVSNPAWTSSAETTAWSNTWALGTGNGGGSPNQASWQIVSSLQTAQAYWNWTVAESGAGAVVTFKPVVVAAPSNFPPFGVGSRVILPRFKKAA
jgi:hypothetical protein